MAASIPLAFKAPNTTIFSAALTANWQASSVVDLDRYTRCALSVHYDADASGTANVVQFLVFVSNALAAPVAADDEWVAVSEVDTSGTKTTLTGTVPSGGDVTLAPEWANNVIRPASWKTEAADNGTDKIRVPLVIDVRSWRWLIVWVKELGDTDAGDLGAATVKAALSA